MTKFNSYTPMFFSSASFFASFREVKNKASLNGQTLVTSQHKQKGPSH